MTTAKDYASLDKFTIPKKRLGLLTSELSFFKKALQRNPFYHFNTLKNYLPLLKSKSELIESGAYFKGDVIRISLQKGQTLANLTAMEKLELVDKFLAPCTDKIKRNLKKRNYLKNIPPTGYQRYV